MQEKNKTKTSLQKNLLSGFPQKEVDFILNNLGGNAKPQTLEFSITGRTNYHRFNGLNYMNL